MVFTSLNLMHADTIQITLLKLKDGTRLLRLTESETGLALERALNPNRPLLRQKRQCGESAGRNGGRDLHPDADSVDDQQGGRADQRAAEVVEQGSEAVDGGFQRLNLNYRQRPRSGPQPL